MCAPLLLEECHNDAHSWICRWIYLVCSAHCVLQHITLQHCWQRQAPVRITQTGVCVHLCEQFVMECTVSAQVVACSEVDFTYKLLTKVCTAVLAQAFTLRGAPCMAHLTRVVAAADPQAGSG